MIKERLCLSAICAIGLSTAFNVEAAACTYERAHYTYTADPGLTTSFVKLPPTADFLGDLGMFLDVHGEHRYAFVFDGGSRFTKTIIPVPFTGAMAWTIVEGKRSETGLLPMDFHQWSGDELFDTVPQTGTPAPEVLFIPALDEALRHPPSPTLRPGPGFFKLSQCE